MGIIESFHRRSNGNNIAAPQLTFNLSNIFLWDVIICPLIDILFALLHSIEKAVVYRQFWIVFDILRVCHKANIKSYNFASQVFGNIGKYSFVRVLINPIGGVMKAGRILLNNAIAIASRPEAIDKIFDFLYIILKNSGNSQRIFNKGKAVETIEIKSAKFIAHTL